MTTIVGAGLSGLLTAFRLKAAGIPFRVLEARARVGGRIHTVWSQDGAPLEMGATWFSDQHMHLKALLDELEIDCFEQYMEGTAFFQPFSTSPAEAIQMPSQPPSYRISGGTSHLINTLYQKLDESEVLLNQTVREIRFDGHTVQVIAQEVFESSRVVLSLPPKLWAKNILFEPPLPSNLVDTARQTQTWMEDSIKVALTYKEPFWQQENLSGTLFSNAGPISELYDHSNHERSKYALGGFVNASFQQLGIAERRMSVMQQLKNVFGAKAAAFVDYEECVWSREESTFAASDVALYPHQNNGNPIFREAYCNEKLLVSSAESALALPGYMDGAVSAANARAQKIIAAGN